MKKAILFILALCISTFFAQNVTAQDIPLQVIGTSGGYFHQASVGDLHWTIGEIMTETYSNSEILTQGFHQLYYNLVPVWEKPELDFEMSIFPNPTTDWVTLEMNLDKPLQGIIRNVLGQEIKRFNLEGQQSQINLSGLSEGIYLLSIYDSQNILKTYRIQKVNL